MTKFNIQLLLKKYNLENILSYSKLRFNKNNSISYYGNVNFKDCNIIPIIFKRVSGDFHCKDIHRLDYLPLEVGGTLFIYEDDKSTFVDNNSIKGIRKKNISKDGVYSYNSWIRKRCRIEGSIIVK